MSNNSVKDWGEFDKLTGLPCLVELLFVGRCFIISAVTNSLVEQFSKFLKWYLNICVTI